MGPANVRDLGGLPLIDGGVTQYGVLWRGDALYRDDAAPALPEWPPRVVIDLRSAKEHEAAGFEWPEATEISRLPLVAAADPRHLDVPSLDVLYEQILEGSADQIVAIVPLLAEAGPTYVHCAAGKDRTGVAVAVLLLVAGVTPEAVVEDYLRTNVAMPGVIDRLVVHGGLDLEAVDQTLLAAPAEAIDVVVCSLTQADGGPMGWFLARGGDADAVDALRKRLRS